MLPEHDIAEMRFLQSTAVTGSYIALCVSSISRARDCGVPAHSPSQHSGLTTQWPDRTSTLHEAFGASHRPLAPWRWATTHDLVDPAEALSGSPDELRLERPFLVTGNLDRDMATGLGQHRLEPCSVANVGRFPIWRRLFFVVGEVLSHFFVQGSFEDGFGELFDQPIRSGHKPSPPPSPGVRIPPRRS